MPAWWTFSYCPIGYESTESQSNNGSYNKSKGGHDYALDNKKTKHQLFLSFAVTIYLFMIKIDYSSRNSRIRVSWIPQTTVNVEVQIASNSITYFATHLLGLLPRMSRV